MYLSGSNENLKVPVYWAPVRRYKELVELVIRARRAS